MSTECQKKKKKKTIIRISYPYADGDDVKYNDFNKILSGQKKISRYMSTCGT